MNNFNLLILVFFAGQICSCTQSEEITRLNPKKTVEIPDFGCNGQSAIESAGASVSFSKQIISQLDKIWIQLEDRKYYGWPVIGLARTEVFDFISCDKIFVTVKNYPTSDLNRIASTADIEFKFWSHKPKFMASNIDSFSITFINYDDGRVISTPSIMSDLSLHDKHHLTEKLLEILETSNAAERSVTER